MSDQARKAPSTETSTPMLIEHRAPVPDHEFQRPRHRGFAHAGDRRALHDGVREQRDRDHEAGDADEAGNGRGADVRPLLGVAGIDARALDSDEHEHRDQHRVADLLEQTLSGMPSPP